MLATTDKQSLLQERIAERFNSPVYTTVDELVSLRDIAQTLSRRSRRRLRSDMSGPEASAILGRGLDFAEVRGYQPGDDVRMIDWKVTARTGQAHTKLFVEEKERPIFIVVDCRSSMRFGTRRMFKSVLAARLAAILGWCAVSNNDRVGGLVFTDGKHREIKPQAGRRGLMMLFRAIEEAHAKEANFVSGEGHSALADESVNATANKTESEVAEPVVSSDESLSAHLLQQLNRLRHIVHTGSSVYVLSDFTGFDAACESALGPLARSSDMLGLLIEDPLDHALPPPGRYSVAGRSGRVTIETSANKIRRFYEHRHHQLGERLNRFFSGNRCQLLPLSTDTDFIDLVTQMLSRTSLGQQV
ncbi:MAG: DUF58 domain-containing protein [Granulosicoccus sp.]|nr:DUF58 domain-containing protein [Granulosicoccus sp.]